MRHVSRLAPDRLSFPEEQNMAQRPALSTVHKSGLMQQNQDAEKIGLFCCVR
jgi:hypothetical protein